MRITSKLNHSGYKVKIHFREELTDCTLGSRIDLTHKPHNLGFTETFPFELQIPMAHRCERADAYLVGNNEAEISAASCGYSNYSKLNVSDSRAARESLLSDGGGTGLIMKCDHTHGEIMTYYADAFSPCRTAWPVKTVYVRTSVPVKRVFQE